ncbi:hypothetical protein ID866_13363 [Astraeus odoratus]|nr:hypothetical protein ID866_13363 [Astraeus odoratus]
MHHRAHYQTCWRVLPTIK